MGSPRLRLEFQIPDLRFCNLRFVICNPEGHGRTRKGSALGRNATRQSLINGLNSKRGFQCQQAALTYLAL
jgi:hypothetical protein